MASRSLKDLLPQVQLKAEEFFQLCADNGRDVLIYCTQRSKEEQDVLYAQGRTISGKIVTNARGGYSWHNFGRAFDFVPLIAGKPQWDNSVLYSRCGRLAEEIGLEWAGRWTGRLREVAHLQYTNGISIDQARKNDNHKM